MKEVTGNLWTYPADVRVITTNGFVKKNGEAVMGRGCALEAAKKYPSLPKVLGDHIKSNGNHVSWLYGCDRGELLWSFPVKHNWYEKADLTLIERSARELYNEFNAKKSVKVVVLPRPGCGNGQLNWNDVRPILEPILDDRFHVITFGDSNA